MRRKQIVWQCFPVRQGQYLKPIRCDRGLVFVGWQAEIEAHGLFQPDGFDGASGNDQCQSGVSPGTLADGQGIAAAM
jgi:hypothetical protein